MSENLFDFATGVLKNWTKQPERVEEYLNRLPFKQTKRNPAHPFNRFVNFLYLGKVYSTVYEAKRI
jgi:hypothetical protein